MNENQERVLMGYVGFLFVEGGYISTYEYRRLNYITTADSCYVSRVDKNKGNPLTDTTKWICIASGAAATAAATQCLQRIEELNELITQLQRERTAIQDASAVTVETAAALAQIESKMADVMSMSDTMEQMLSEVRSATNAANQAYALASQIEGVNVMAGKPASMALRYVTEARVGVYVKIEAVIYPDTANQSVVFIPLGGAVVTPDGVVKSPAEAGTVKVYVVCTEQSGVWKEVSIVFREGSALCQHDGTVLTQADGQSLYV